MSKFDMEVLSINDNSKTIVAPKPISIHFVILEDNQECTQKT
jgi:hypothetical protein